VNFGPEGAPVMVRIPPDPSLPAERRNWQASWPLQDYLELAAVTEAVPSARYHARLVLREWQAAPLADNTALADNTELAYDIEQVVAELVANAVTATQSVRRWMPKQPPVRLWLLGRAERVTTTQAMVIVWDATTAIPVPKRPTQDEESGRGMLLVGALAHWGYYPPPHNYGGKVVHALLPKR
jgi:hypothetical protein